MSCPCLPAKKFWIFTIGQSCVNEIIERFQWKPRHLDMWSVTLRCIHCGNLTNDYGLYETFVNVPGFLPAKKYKARTIIPQVVIDLVHELAFTIAEPQEDIGGYLFSAEQMDKFSEQVAIMLHPKSDKCQADMWADPPRDCDFPFCGCDPSANAAIETLQESGLLRDRFEKKPLPRGWLWTRPSTGEEGIFLREDDARQYAKDGETLPQPDQVFPLYIGDVETTWNKITDRLPIFAKNKQIVIYTQTHEFNGQQFFTVMADYLNDAFFGTEIEQPDECKFATHWIYKDDLIRAIHHELPSAN